MPITSENKPNNEGNSLNKLVDSLRAKFKSTFSRESAVSKATNIEDDNPQYSKDIQQARKRAVSEMSLAFETELKNIWSDRFKKATEILNSVLINLEDIGVPGDYNTLENYREYLISLYGTFLRYGEQKRDELSSLTLTDRKSIDTFRSQFVELYLQRAVLDMTVIAQRVAKNVDKVTDQEGIEALQEIARTLDEGADEAAAYFKADFIVSKDQETVIFDPTVHNTFLPLKPGVQAVVYSRGLTSRFYDATVKPLVTRM